MTVREYRLSLGWSVSELARRAGITNKTLNRIENGEPVYDYTVGSVARALSEGLGRTITIHDLEGVNIVKR
jgi:transcriptional regulator with XRE-family HTH domain